jgi:hypothetical protein
MDNDGYKDIYVCNGIYHDFHKSRFCWFLREWIYAKMVVSGKKEQIETIINRMPSTPILIMLLKTIKT